MMPWRAFTSPIDQWAVLPTFLIGEYVFIALAGALLVHATKSGRTHVLYWIGALVAGTANDLIFMALPLVDNFWHSQASIMLTPRLPLYIPCVYVSFMYLPGVAVRRLGLPLFSGAALTGLLALLFYAPFDITGAKLVWWTWHDTDLPVAQRLLGAPASSSLWVLTFTGSFALLLGWAVKRDPDVSTATFARGLILVAALSSTVMVLQITVLQQLDGGAPGYVALGVGVGLYVTVAALGTKQAKPTPAGQLDWMPNVGVVVYYVALWGCVALFDPTAHRSTGVHQEVGECGVEVADIAGLTRHQFLCASDFEESFTFDCVEEPPPDGASWYTVCGRGHASRSAWIAAVMLYGVVGTLIFSFLFGGFPRRRR
ncbi:MAG: hypothetical protein ACRBN8_30305 [Nannocystales bacterium]